jgi:hypothetical protein
MTRISSKLSASSKRQLMTHSAITNVVYRMFATSVKSDDPKESISGKEFYKAMQKVKDRGMNAVPPKKSASAYIIFGKEVS